MEERRARDAAESLENRSGFVILSTLDETGCPETRTLFNLRSARTRAFEAIGPLPGGVFATMLGTNTSSRKVAQAKKDARCCLYYADDERYEGLAIKGLVVEERDPGRRDALWTPEWEIYYPGGKDGGDFTVLRFEPGTARYYHGLKVVEFDCATGR